ncbi:GmrSD restriction endonuclease domain-containing protein [Micromonospora echinofusca]|uniref:GmrSD restriction endonuclease domain-containing protein n=1 Tax=Micromonospora echinofusca TaxID=47858 RepID=UPI0037196B52
MGRIVPEGGQQGIDGRGYSVRELFGKRYGLEHYQREYSWERGHVRELLADLSRRFLSQWRPDHDRGRILEYRPYFLGSFVCYPAGPVRNLVDGQQRFTTLHLLLIHLKKLLVEQAENDTATMVGQLVSTYAVGRHQYTISVAERDSCLAALLGEEEFDIRPDTPVSVRNLWHRGRELNEDFPEELRDDALPFFADWLLDRVFMVEISAFDRDHGWEIFETMNDRGARLTPLDLLKSFLLSHAHEQHAELNAAWRDMLTRLGYFGSHTPNEFFKELLLARYALLEGDDPKVIQNAFHEWVRENCDRLGLLRKGVDFRNFITGMVLPLARFYAQAMRASKELTDGLEEVYFNHTSGIDSQSLLMMAALQPTDTSDIFRQKCSLIAKYLDLLHVRWFVSNKPVQPGDFREEAERLLPRIRNVTSVDDLRRALGREIAALDADFGAVPSVVYQDKTSHLRYLLARITSFVQVSSGRANEIEVYLGTSSGVPWEVEHIWANKFERHQSADVPNEKKFQQWRNNIGCLLLLSKPDNASFGADPYAAKLKHYRQRVLLAASLHADTYTRDPSFVRFVRDSGLTGNFKPYPDGFDINSIKERAELYKSLCENIWNPRRLGFEMPREVVPPQRRRRRANYKVSIAQLVQAKFIEGGTTVFGSRGGQRYEAEVTGQGRLILEDGRSFESLSTAGSAVLGGASCNGWTFWNVQQRGVTWSMSDIRKRALEQGILDQVSVG